jgi:hypothetical protein
VGEPRLLFGGRPDVESEVLGRPIERWMWGGLPTQVALDQWAQVSASWVDECMGECITPGSQGKSMESEAQYEAKAGGMNTPYTHRHALTE